MGELKQIAKEVRKDIIRMIELAGSGHPGGSLSCVEIVVSLYHKVMRHKSKNPKWPDRDRFVLSKGHGVPTLYSVLSRTDYFPREWLWNLRKCGTPLQGHPYMRSTPGIEASTGSLGQGLSIANGMALAGKIDNKDYRVYVLIGDGEANEGQIWEASMSAKRYKLDTLCAILDHNKLQIDGTIKEIKDPYPLKEKWQAFGWEVFEVDGHNFNELLDAFSMANQTKGKPTMIIANTVKGKGVSFMENRIEWHGKEPNAEQAKQALKEIENA
ncbi:transketolase [candidate division WOR-3 bacterium]|nr:transketolase [candidate division WOR-3 bacterium]